MSENVSKEPLKFVWSLQHAVAGIRDKTFASIDGVTICPYAELYKITKKNVNNFGNFNFESITEKF